MIDNVRQSANHYFFQGDFDTTLPLYGLTVDLLDKSWRSDFPQNPSTDNKRKETVKDGDDEEENSSICVCNQAAFLFKMEQYEETQNTVSHSINVSQGECSDCCVIIYHCEVLYSTSQ